MTHGHSIWRIIIYNNGITLTTSINLLYYCWKNIYRRNSNKPLQEEKHMQATTIVTPANQRGRSVSLTLKISNKRKPNNNISHNWSILWSYNNVKIQIRMRRKHYLNYNMKQSQRNIYEFKESEWRTIRYTQILSTPVIWFLCLRNSLVISEYLKDNGSARILLSADVYKPS